MSLPIARGEIDVPIDAYDWLRHGDTRERINFDAADNVKVLWNATMLFFRQFDGHSPSMRAFRLFYLMWPRGIMKRDEDHIALYLPEGFSIHDVHGWNRSEFFRKVTKAFVAEDMRKRADQA
jgi:hypothetical protein